MFPAYLFVYGDLATAGMALAHYLPDVGEIVKHLMIHGASLMREGSRHSIFQRGQRKKEMVDDLARKICKDLDIPFVR